MPLLTPLIVVAFSSLVLPCNAQPKTKPDKEPRVLKGHTDWVVYLDFSPDGKRLATGGAFLDSTIRIWDLAKGKQAQLLHRNEKYIAQVAYSPDGKSLASFGRYYDNKVRVWDVETGKLRYEFGQVAIPAGRDSLGIGLAFSPDGKMLAVASLRLKVITLRDAGTGKVLGSLDADGWVDALAFSPDGKTLAITFTRFGNGDTVSTWDLATKKMKFALPNDDAPDGVPTDLRFSPDGKLLAEIVGDTVPIWDVAAQKRLRKFTRPEHLVAMTFTAAGELLALESDGSTSRDYLDLWNVTKNKRLRRLEVPGRMLYDAVFSRQGSQLAAAADDSSILVWAIPP
jgi:WD40 repeat protein